MTETGAPAQVVVVATMGTALAWAEALGARGIPARACAPRVIVPPPDPGAVARALASHPEALLLATSPNAVLALPEGAGAGRVAAAVGPATAAALTAAGMRVAWEGGGGAEDLARRLVASGPARRVLWLRGDRARPEGAALLRAAGWEVVEVVAYGTARRPEFAADLARGPARAYVLGSPGAVRDLTEAWAAGAVGGWAGVPVIAVGATTLAALVEVGVRQGRVAVAPTTEAVLAAVAAALRAPSEGAAP